MSILTFFVHLIPHTTLQIQETLKVVLPEGALVNDLRLAILEQLHKANDGNKEYRVQAITASPDPAAETIPLHRLLESHFESHSDVYSLIDIKVDTKRHVKPVEVRPAKQGAGVSKEPSLLAGDDKYVSVVKYSYYESGTKYVKVVLDSHFKGIGAHPKEKVFTEFKQRSFTIKVLDFKGVNYQFTVPRLQCKIAPQDCSFTLKTDSILITLRKFKDDDNWWSLFKSKAIGEVESD
ncbi:hypothetical protein FGO68_gene16351 [Halteria grandinella]|uniref:CS domain-containing protein n=1 Tax=Halteria grandinella TaxID=5974 RepID=A0A8J8T7R4_HALGN|nr:hypothetical protein FGO68_gene16351 [Halteria grandinella]